MMADNIVQNVMGGLFTTPEDVKRQQYAQMQANALAESQMGPAQAANYYGGMAGGQLGGMLRDTLGLPNPKVQEAQQQQAMIQGVDFHDPKSIRERALQIQDPKMKFQLEALARQAELETSKMAHEAAQTLQFEAQASKALREPTGSDTMQQFAEWKKTNPNGNIVEFRKAVEKDQYEKISPVSGQTPEGRQVYYTDTGQQFTIENNNRVPYSGKIITPAGMRISMQQPVLSEDDKSTYIKAIASHEKPFPNRYELSKVGINPMSLVAQVKKENPNWSESDFANVKLAEQRFSSGKQGDTIRSIGTANRHLDTVSELGAALNSGDIKLINKARASWLENTGSSLPTNLEAASTIVGAEVIKGVVGAINGEKEREKATELLSSAKSWSQLKDSVGTIKNLLSGQEVGLFQQYKQSTKKPKSYSISDFRNSMYGNSDNTPAPIPAPTPPPSGTSGNNDQYEYRTLPNGKTQRRLKNG